MHTTAYQLSAFMQEWVVGEITCVPCGGWIAETANLTQAILDTAERDHLTDCPAAKWD